MTYLPVYFAKNNYYYAFPFGDASYLQAVLFNSDTALNPLAPMLAGSISDYYKFNLKEVLSTASIFPKIELSNLPTNGHANLKLVKTIKVRTNPFGSNAYSFSADFHFLSASITPLLEDVYGQNLSVNYLGAKKKFLSNSPKKKLTDSNCQEWLYFLNNISENVTDFTLNIRVFKKDYQQVIFTETLVSEKYDILTFNTAWQRIKTTYNLGDEVIRYDCFLTANNEIISETKTYYIDHYPPEEVEVLYFKTRFGLFDSIRFLGSKTLSNEYEHLSFETPAEQIDYLTTTQTKVLFRTGELIQGWLEYLADELLSSQEIYWDYQLEQKVKLSKTATSITYLDPTDVSDDIELEFKFAKISTTL